LGTRFLKHVERTKILVHLIDVSPMTGRDPVRDYEVIMVELAAFSPVLAAKTQILAANKTDLLGGGKARLERIKRLAKEKGVPFYSISALTGKGLKELVVGMARAVREAEAKAEDDRK
jgi:GTP-binding protein